MGNTRPNIYVSTNLYMKQNGAARIVLILSLKTERVIKLMAQISFILVSSRIWLFFRPSQSTLFFFLMLHVPPTWNVLKCSHVFRTVWIVQTWRKPFLRVDALMITCPFVRRQRVDQEPLCGLSNHELYSKDLVYFLLQSPVCGGSQMPLCLVNDLTMRDKTKNLYSLS